MPHGYHTKRHRAKAKARHRKERRHHDAKYRRLARVNGIYGISLHDLCREH